MSFVSNTIAVTTLTLFLSAIPSLKAQTNTSAGQVIDSDAWKITFPVKNSKGNALEILNPEFSRYVKDEVSFPSPLNKYFYKTNEGLVFFTEYTGATTSSGTKYSRTELREMRGREQNNWTLAEGGSLQARLKVMDLQGDANKVIFMQIHGRAPESKPLLKCIWEKGNIRLLTKTGAKLKDLKRKQKYVDVGQDNWFTCAINVNSNTINILVNGKTIESFGPEVLGSWPKNNTYYFKAGNYLQHDQPGAGAKLVFSSIAVSH